MKENAGKEESFRSRKWLLLALMILAAVGVALWGSAGAESDADSQYAQFLETVSNASRDESAWVVTQDKNAPVREGTVSRPQDADIADLGANGFLVLQEGVTLIQETGGAEGIVAQPVADGENPVYRLTGYRTGTRSTDLSAGSRVVIAEQDAAGNWLLNMGTVSSLDGSVLLTLNKPTQGDQARYIRSFSLHSGQNGNGTVSIPLDNITIHIPGVPGTVTSQAVIKINGRIEIYGDAAGDWSFWHTYFWLDMKLTFRLVADYFYIDVASESLGYFHPIIPIQIPIVPGIVGIDISPKVGLNGSAKGQVQFALNAMWGIDMRVSYNYDIADKFFGRVDMPTDGPHFTGTSYAMQGKVFAGLKWGGNLSLFGGLLSLGVNYQDGILLTADLRGGGTDPGDPEKKIWHACEDMKCLSGDIKWQKGPISIGLSGFWGLVSKTLVNLTDPIFSDPFVEFYHSFTYNDGGATKCPHIGYRIDVHVTDMDGHPIQGAEVSLTPREDWFKSQTDKIKTDASGIATVYAQRANPTKDTKDGSTLDVTITASYVDPEDPEKKPITLSTTVTEKGLNAKQERQPKDVYLKLDIRKIYLKFEDPGSGHAVNMPSAVLFFPGRSVRIPATTPSKSGLHFLGWSTNPDGSGIHYAPGATLKPDGDMTLYARWRVISDVWYVMFDANGGTYAPEPQVGVNNQPMELTTEEAKWENHTFLGWAYEPDAMVVDFPVGYLNLVPYDQVTKVVTLYALWGFKPVSKPIHITYDMNGAPEGQTPPGQWIERMSYMQVSGTVPTWEGHNFLGWSVEKDAGAGEMHPGQYYYFEEDTVIYAIWGYDPVLKPVIVTYLMNGGPESEKPEPQVEKQGAWFHLSSKIPVWDNQHIFEGWKRYRDREKAEYSAGEAVRFDENTTLYAVWEIGYRITEGNGSGWNRDSGEKLRFVADGSFTYFTGITIDGTLIAKKYYSASPGSTVVELKPEFLQTLALGSHTIQVVYADGAAEGTFSVLAPIPKTGDDSNPLLWGLMMVVGTIGMIGIRRKRV